MYAALDCCQQRNLDWSGIARVDFGTRRKCILHCTYLQYTLGMQMQRRCAALETGARFRNKDLCHVATRNRLPTTVACID